jgi:hypothetical protein
VAGWAGAGEAAAVSSARAISASGNVGRVIGGASGCGAGAVAPEPAQAAAAF